mgnify:CR=1 FL=1
MMMTNTLGRYFAGKFVGTALAVFSGIFVLVLLIDYIEMSRRTSGIAAASAGMVALTSAYRVPQLLERMMPFCVLVATMVCYLGLSRRYELVVARAAGISAWQFLTPALVSALVLGAGATLVYNPVSANLQERAKQMEATFFAKNENLQETAGFWLNQVASDGQTIINARSSQQRGTVLTGLTVFRFNTEGRFVERIEANEAVLEPGFWVLKGVRRFQLESPRIEQETFRIATNLSADQVLGRFATPDSVPFWELPEYIESSVKSGSSGAGYRLQFHKLLAQPFLLAAMVLLASATSLKFIRLGGVQKLVLGGVIAGFLLYVLSKATEDLSKAELMHPFIAAWLPIVVGSFTGVLALLYQEDG